MATELKAEMHSQFEYAVALQNVDYQFQQTSEGRWLFQCSEWLDVSSILTVVLRSIPPAPAEVKPLKWSEVIEECAKVAEGPLYKEHYRGHEGHNWSAERHPGNPYGNGRMDAAAAIRTLSAPVKQSAETEQVEGGVSVEPAGYLYRLRYGPDRWSHHLMFSEAAVFKSIPAEDVKEVTPLYASSLPAQSEVAETPGAREAFTALDLADRLIERAYGSDVPTEWGKAYRGVARARSAALKAGRE